MKAFIRLNRLVLIFVLIVTIGLLFLVTYYPSYNALKDVTIENFYHNTEANSSAVTIAIENNVTSAKSMSSRSAIRNKIVDYNNGLVTFQELYDFSYSKYMDGYNVIESAQHAIRVVNGTVLLDTGENLINVQEVLNDVERYSELKFFITGLDLDQLIVYSPISVEDEIVGFDVILFSLEDSLQSIKQEGYQIDIIHEVYLEDNLVRTTHENTFESSDGYVHVTELTSAHVLTQNISRDYLFKDVADISISNIVKTLFLTLVAIVILNIVMMRFAREIINKLTNQQEHYKHKVLNDSLTKVYSRDYLDQLLADQTILLDRTSVIMMDVDNFKRINDEYGHLIGDKVLSFIGLILNSSFRQNDHIIRFGGDEFLVILQGTSFETADRIMRRVNSKLQQLNDFDFKISLSYGISSATSFDDLNSAIQAADVLMYKNKKDNLKPFDIV